MTVAPHLVPDMPDTSELIPWLRQIDANRWYTNYGPLVQQFEARLHIQLQAANSDRVFALTTLATGHHALHLGLQALGLPEDAAVLLPAVTFPACPLAVRQAGLTPVLADVDSTCWQLTPAIARAAVARHKLAAIMPVATYGVPVDAAAWDDFSEDTGLPVLIDAAAAFGAQRLPRRALVAFSFHATKPLGIGEGGLLVGDAARIAAVRQLSQFGCVARIAQDWGTNAKLSEYHAAVGLAQLDRWAGIVARRRAVVESYRLALADMPLVWQAGFAQAVPSLLMLNCAPLSAPEIIRTLVGQGVPAHQTYLPPLYDHPAFAALRRLDAEGRVVARCPVAEQLAAHIVGLPFHGFLTDEAVRAIVATLRLMVKQLGATRV